MNRDTLIAYRAKLAERLKDAEDNAKVESMPALGGNLVKEALWQGEAVAYDAAIRMLDEILEED